MRCEKSGVLFVVVVVIGRVVGVVGVILLLLFVVVVAVWLLCLFFVFFHPMSTKSGASRRRAEKGKRLNEPKNPTHVEKKKGMVYNPELRNPDLKTLREKENEDERSLEIRVQNTPQPALAAVPLQVVSYSVYHITCTLICRFTAYAPHEYIYIVDVYIYRGWSFSVHRPHLRLHQQSNHHQSRFCQQGHRLETKKHRRVPNDHHEGRIRAIAAATRCHDSITQPTPSPTTPTARGNPAGRVGR